jgi:hypothetical protein
VASNLRQPGPIARAIRSIVRVLFTTLLFTCGGMGLGLLLGIIGMIIYGLIAGVQPDMRNAYRHVAMPIAITAGSIAFISSLVLEFRSRTHQS